MGRYSGKSCRIVSMLVLTTSFLIVEITVGHMANSLALIADAFHMMSDTMALIVGLAAVKLARRGACDNKTYGWARAEVVGALVNAVFLVALCFTIFVEAVERLVMREPIEDAYLLLYVGSMGLAINLLGLCLFHDHAHGHTHGGGSHTHSHSHGHSHGHSGKHNHSPITPDDTKISADLDEDKEEETVAVNGNGTALLNSPDDDQAKPKKGGDIIGNGTLPERDPTLEKCHHTHPDWVLCIDPILSLLLVIIILSTSLPLLKHSANILMQTVPEHIKVSQIKKDIEQMAGVARIHECHVWGLSGNKIIASMHIHTKTLEDYIRVADKIKRYLHDEGIHSVTIQPEFCHLQTLTPGRECTLECGPELDCHADTCCGRKANLVEQELDSNDNMKDTSIQVRQRNVGADSGV